MSGRGRASVKDMERVETSILMCIAHAQGDAVGPVRLSRNGLSHAAGVSAYRAGTAAARLVEHGLVECRASFSADGGQQANAYALTELGAWYYHGIETGIQLERARA